MGKLVYCEIQVFGSGFEAKDFSNEISVVDSSVRYNKYPIKNSTIRAFKTGDFSIWKSPKYYIENISVNDYLQEELFALKILELFVDLPRKLEKYCTETTEVWFVMVYKSDLNESPSGVHFSSRFLNKLSSLGMSLSTDIM